MKYVLPYGPDLRDGKAEIVEEWPCHYHPSLKLYRIRLENGLAVKSRIDEFGDIHDCSPH